MLNKIKQYFKDLFGPIPQEEKLPKTLDNLQILEDVWVEKDGDIQIGWVWEITKKAIFVVICHTSEIVKIHYNRPCNVSIIKDGKITLYLNENGWN